MRLSGTLLTLTACTLVVEAVRWSDTKNVLGFGDSYTFVAGTMGHTNFSFFGDRLNLTVTREQVRTSEIIYNRTSSDGANWVEMITGCYRGRPSKCPRTLWNFAFAGAAIDPTIITPHTEWVVPMIEQVGQWVQAREDNLLEAPGNDSLAAFFIGINDTSDVKGWTNITDWTAFWGREMDSYFKAVEQVYNTGLRSFLFLNVPTRDRSPGSIGRPDVANQIAQVRNFNTLLEQRVNAFKASRNHVSVVLFDTNKLMDEVLDNPPQELYLNMFRFCKCSDPGYFWYDSGHVTERVHRLVANGVLSKLEGLA
ncbi:unnamed protein product [Rhizoctonia solani]|uniref:Carbohydrate esterase family 16 protein n=1 Tax=Rhizoctonia solani TaxID=456999 RepID=A0A8H2XWP0_9AGAM|nr:unnamed protein product [Rhizoctonia solani]